MPQEDSTGRTPLSRERVLRAAVRLADRKGLDALTMRRLGKELGVEAMSLYKHVANKDDILDGIVELVIGEIAIPEEGTDWRQAMRQRAASAREVLGRHSWAVGLFETRGTMGPTVLRYVNAILGSLRAAGFSVGDATHAFWMLDSYVYGHVIQETSISVGTPEDVTASATSILDQIQPGELPHLAEVGTHALSSGYSFDAEFEFGLDLILDGLERLRDSGAPGGTPE